MENQYAQEKNAISSPWDTILFHVVSKEPHLPACPKRCKNALPPDRPPASARTDNVMIRSNSVMPQASPLSSSGQAVSIPFSALRPVSKTDLRQLLG
jgi:hypothetical protein